MTERTSVGDLQVATCLYDFVNEEVLPGTEIDPGDGRLLKGDELPAPAGAIGQ